MNGPDKSDIAADLAAMGIGDGDTLLVQASAESLNAANIHPRVIVEACLEAVGATGNLVVPTLVSAFHGIQPPFNPAGTPSETGCLAETVRKWPGARRSDHPTHSIAVIGPDAEILTAGHSAGGWGPNTPWGANAVGFGTPWERLFGRNAWILLLGVGFECCTMLQHVQVRYLAEKEGITASTPWPEFDFNRLADLLGAGIVQEGKIGTVPCRLVRSGALVKAALQLLYDRGEEFLTAPHLREWLTVCNKIAEQGRPMAAGFKAELKLPAAQEEEIERPLHIRGVVLLPPRQKPIVFLV